MTTTLDDYHHIAIGPLRAGGWLRPGLTVALRWTDGVRAEVTVLGRGMATGVVIDMHRGGGRFERTVAPLAWTPLHFGGVRPWFRCPLCLRRAGKLYWTEGENGPEFVCRECTGALYHSQYLRPLPRAILRAQTLARRLGGTGEGLGEIPPRPKGMHWTTYERRVKALERVQAPAFAAMRQFLSW